MKLVALALCFLSSVSLRLLTGGRSAAQLPLPLLGMQSRSNVWCDKAAAFHHRVTLDKPRLALLLLLCQVVEVNALGSRTLSALYGCIVQPKPALLTQLP